MNRSLSTALILVICLVFATSAFSAIDKDKWSFGVKAGLNFSSYNLSGTYFNGITTSSVTKFGIGGVLNYKIDEDMSIRTDVLYLGKGVKLSATGYAGNEVKVTNFVLAPFFVYNITGDPKDMVWFGQGGLELDMNSSADYATGGSINDYTSTEFCLNIRAGVKIPLEKGTLVPDFRYSIGLSNTITTSGATAKSSGVQIMLAYMFK